MRADEGLILDEPIDVPEEAHRRLTVSSVFWY